MMMICEGYLSNYNRILIILTLIYSHLLSVIIVIFFINKLLMEPCTHLDASDKSVFPIRSQLNRF